MGFQTAGLHVLAPVAVHVRGLAQRLGVAAAGGGLQPLLRAMQGRGGLQLISSARRHGPTCVRAKTAGRIRPTP